MQFKCKLAPIGVSTYNRIEHLKQTIEALQVNTLAKESELYIFSDAPKEGDEKIVSVVRNYIHTIDGFKKVHIVERKTNGRVANNRGGIKELLDEYGKCIFLEDDIVTGPGFLQFMNDALRFYKDDDRVTFVSGYLIPGIELNKNYLDDVLMIGRFESWGMGMWQKSFQYLNNIDIKRYQKISKNKNSLKELKKRSGDDVPELIEMDILGKINGGDIKIWFWQFIFDTFTVCPKKSLVQSIGQDGTGVHMGISNRWNIKKVWDIVEFKMVEDIQVIPAVEKMNFNFYKFTVKEKLIKYLLNKKNKNKSLHILYEAYKFMRKKI